MEYESVILKRLIKTYGVVGNPRYISEIIKEFIIQGKERYPELFTYQADWLAHIDEFGLNPSYAVSYTGQSIYAPNTLERPVKSAILKGNTGYRDIDTGEFLETFEEGRNLELVSVKMPVLSTTGKNKWKTDSLNPVFDVGLLNVETNDCTVKMTNIGNSWRGITIDSPLKGEGVISFNANISLINDSTKQIRVSADDIQLGRLDATRGRVKIKIPQGAKTISLKVLSPSETNVDFEIYDIQLEEGSVATPSEPYKSNILTVNEEVVLRGFDSVEDTLNLNTGEYVKRIGELTLDGSEHWLSAINDDGTMRFNHSISDFKNYGDGSNGKNLINNKLPKVTFSTSGNRYGVSTWCNRVIFYTEHTNVNDFKQWLSQNPTTVQCELETPIVKTVDLTILDQNGQNVKQLMSFNGGTHFNTGSLEGSLIPSVSVTVETDLEETLKVCSLEGNTM